MSQQEKIIFQTPLPWRSYWKEFLLALITLIVVVPSVLIIVSVFIDRKFLRKYIITTKRIKISYLNLLKLKLYRREIPIKQITAIDIQQNVIQMFLNIGDISIDTKGTGRDISVILHNIPFPDQVASEIQEQIVK